MRVFRRRQDDEGFWGFILFGLYVVCLFGMQLGAGAVNIPPTVLPTAYVRKFRSVGDLAIRRSLIAHTLHRASEASIAHFLTHLLAHLDRDGIKPLYLDTILSLLEPRVLTKAIRRDLYGRLIDDRFAPVYRFLSDVHDRRPPAISREYPYELEDEALGVRKSRARSRTLNTLKTVAADPDPEVIRILLENPMTTEDLILKVASLRPQTAASFPVILWNTRFGIRELVQAAVVQNPFSPVRLAAAAVPLLSRVHLDQVSSSRSLDPRVRDAAHVMLRER